MVAQRFLVPFVGVQIPVSLPFFLRSVPYLRGASFFSNFIERDFYLRWSGSPRVRSSILSLAWRARNESL